MKNKIKIFVSIVLTSVVLLMNSGFTVSHVHCSKGGQWIIGSEMPPLKLKSHLCKKFAKKNRQIDIYQFSFAFESEVGVEKQDVSKLKVNKNNQVHYTYKKLFTQNKNVYKKIDYIPPLNNNSTCIIKLQQFLI